MLRCLPNFALLIVFLELIDAGVSGSPVLLVNPLIGLSTGAWTDVVAPAIAREAAKLR